MQYQINSRIKEIESFIVRAESKDIPEEIRSYMARFGAVLVCGFVERSVEIVIMERLGKRAHDRVLNFIKSHFKKGTNYNCEAIRQLLERFDPKWNARFSEFLTINDELNTNIVSAYVIRNSVAHGGSNSLAISRLKEIFESSKKLIEALISSTK